MRTQTLVHRVLAAPVLVALLFTALPVFAGSIFTSWSGAAIEGGTVYLQAGYFDACTTGACQRVNQNITVYWGDGSYGVYGGDTNYFIGHVYAAVGTYSVTLAGYTTCGGFFCNTNDHAGTGTSITISGATLSAAGRTFLASVGATYDGPVATLQDGNPYRLASDVSASIAWGDGQSSPGRIADKGNGSFDVYGTHVYAAPGTYAVAVSARSNVGSTASVVSTASAGNCVWPSFGTPLSVPAGGATGGVVAGDFNEDGIPDLIVANYGGNVSGSVAYLRGLGAGAYAPPVALAVGYGPYYMAVADLDNDGHLDLVVANLYSNSLSILRGRGDGTFAPMAPVATSSGPNQVVVGDFDGDRIPDLVVANRWANTITFHKGDGSGGFAAGVPFPTGAEPYALVEGDFNNDGLPDVAVGNLSEASITVFLGDGAGFFTRSSVAVEGGVTGLAVADLNRDGSADLVVVCGGTTHVNVLLGRGDGTFANPTQFDAPMGANAIAIDDFTGDGKLDVALTFRNLSEIRVYPGNGDGTLAFPGGFPFPGNPSDMTWADLDGDGRPDLAIATDDTGSVLFLPNTNCKPVKLAVTAPGSCNQPGGPLSPPVTAWISDDGGNAAYCDSGTIMASIVPGSGTAGATLGGTTSRPTAGGSATFSDLSISVAGQDYRLAFTHPTLGTAQTPAFNVAAPLAIAPLSLPPMTVYAASSLSLTLTGGAPPYTILLSGALPSGVSFNGLTGPASASISGTPDPTSAGVYPVTVSVTDAKGCSTSVSYTLSVLNPLPAAVSLDLASTPVGSGPLSLTVTGSGFVPSSVATWVGAPRTTVFVSDSQLVVTLPASDFAAPVVAGVRVFSPGPGGGTSAFLPFAVLAADVQVNLYTSTLTPLFGTSVSFRIQATNLGPNVARNVQVAFALPPGLTYAAPFAATAGTWDGATWTIDPLPPGPSVFLQVTARADQIGPLTIGATKTFQDPSVPDPDGTNDAASVAINVQQAADVQLSTSVSNSTPYVGDTVTFTFAAMNGGPADASSVVVTAPLPAGLTFVSAATPFGTYDPVVGTWNIGSLLNGAATALTIVAQVNQSGPISFAAAKTGETQYDQDPSNDTAASAINATPDADVAICPVSASTVAPLLGQNVVLTVKVRNRGPSPATNAVIAAALPAGLAFVSSSPAAGSYDSATGLWMIPTLAPTTTVGLNLTASVGPGAPVTFTATRSAGDQIDLNPANDSASLTLTGVPNADVAVSLSASSPSVVIGQNVTLVVTATNQGPSDTTGLLLKDLLPAGLTYVSHAASQGTYASGGGMWDVGLLGASSSATLTLTAQVAQLGAITDTATRTASDLLDPNAANDAASVTVTGLPSVDVAVTMTANRTTIAVGQNVTYTIKASNLGPQNATGVKILDLLPAGQLTFVSANPAAAYDTATGIWTVGNVAAGAPAVSLTLVGQAVVATPILNTVSWYASDQPDSNALNDSAFWMLNKPAPSTALSSSANPSTFGQSVTFTVTLTSGTGTPTGSVTFKRGGVALGPAVAVSGGVATFTTSTLPVGTSNITVSYQGDALFAPVNSAVLAQKMNKAASATSLAASSTAFPYGTSVTLAATVTSAGGVPNGSVTFRDNGTSLGTAPLVAGVATLTTTKISAGSRSLTAVYGGSPNFNGSTSPVVPASVAKASVTIILAPPAPNPSVYLQTVMFTATITSPTTTPAGSLILREGAKNLIAMAIPGNGVVTFSYSILPAGAHTITAFYAGNGNVASGLSNAVAQVVNPLATVTTLSPATVSPIVYGQNLTFTATVTAVGATPTGVVAFQDGATVVKKNLVAGVATWTPAAPLSAGTHSITASFLGSTNFSPSAAPAPTTVSMSQATTTTTLASTATNVNYAQTVTFTATVTSPTLSPLSGTVTFRNGATVLKPNVALSGGTATWTTPATLAAGSYSVTATLNPTPNILTSTSSAVPLTIAKVATTTTITSSLNPSLTGGTVTYTVAVTAAGPTPTGSVTLKDGATSLGAKALAGGVATWTRTYAAAGPHVISGTYAGTASFQPSSASMTQTVN